MKKLFVIISLLFMSVDVFSQVGIGFGTGGFGMGMNIPINGRKNHQKSNRLENQVQQLKRDLDLNDDQVVKVRGLMIDRDRAHQRGDRNGISNEEFDNRMKEILTPEQFTKYAELKQQKREDRQTRKDEKSKEKEPLPESKWDDVYQ